MTIQVSDFKQYSLLHTPSALALGLVQEHFNSDYLYQHKLVTRIAQGRGTVYFFSLQHTNLVLRHYRRGGLVAKLSDDKFLFRGINNTRCYEELAILGHLREKNVHVPKPIAARVCKKGVFYTADIITEVIPDARELHEVLQQQSVALDTWQAIGYELKKMHNAQVCHDDINVKNILLAQEHQGTSVHLLDFDKCRITPGNNWKAANLERFKRSLRKQSIAFQPYNFGPKDWQQLLMAYEK